MQYNVVIIEDDPEMAGYLQSLLHDESIVAFTALTGAQGLKLVKKLKPELVLLDMNLPDIEGENICLKIKEEYPHIKVIIITAQNTSSDIASGLDLGADDYHTKPIDEVELMARIRAQLRKNKQRRVLLKFHDLSLNQETHEVIRNGRQVDLSAQEFRLLEYLMINQGKVLSRPMILSRIWDGNPDIETRVVDVYINYLRSKLDTVEPKLIRTVRGFGYALRLDKANKQ